MADDPGLRMTFTEHLEELRRRLLVSVVTVLLTALVCYAMSSSKWIRDMA